MRYQDEAMGLYGKDMETLELGDFAFDELGSLDNSEAVFDEIEEMELAAELLEVTNEVELGQFMDKLIKSAGRAFGHLVRSDAGQALKGILKGAAHQALPVLNSSLKGVVSGLAGTPHARKLTRTAGRIFGLELEGLSEEDSEFEVARRFVRFSNAAAQNLATSPRTRNPREAAKAAAIQAAKRHAPGLIRPAKRKRGGHPRHGSTASGRWIRNGRNIIILNCQAPQMGQTDVSGTSGTPGAPATSQTSSASSTPDASVDASDAPY